MADFVCSSWQNEQKIVISIILLAVFVYSKYQELNKNSYIISEKLELQVNENQTAYITQEAIKEALGEGRISESRYNNFIKIYEELKDKEEHKW